MQSKQQRVDDKRLVEQQQLAGQERRLADGRQLVEQQHILGLIHEHQTWRLSCMECQLSLRKLRPMEKNLNYLFDFEI